MAFGTGLYKHLVEEARHPRRRKPAPTPVPFAPTPKGRRAARAAGAYNRPIATFNAGTEDKGGFNPVSTATNTLSDALGAISTSSDPTGITDTGAPARNLVDEEAKNLAEVTQRHFPAVLGGKETLAAVQQPTDAKSLRAAGAILSPVPAGDAASAIKASEKAAQEAGAASRAARAALGGGERTRGVIGKVAAKVEPDVVKGAREAAAKRAAQLPAPVRVGAQVGGKTVSYPLKHPFTAPLAIQVPAFVASGGDPKEFLKALKGEGTLASISHFAGGKVAAALPGEAGQIANEAVNLPAVALPSVFIPAKAAVEAANGNSAEWDKLWKSYKETGLLPAVFSGNTDAALKALKERPLYSGLEASGLLSAGGRTAGAFARKLTNGKVAGLARPDLTVEGYPNIRVQRGYSRDLLRQAIQRASDRKTGSVIRPGTGDRFTPTLERRGDYQFRRHVVRDAGDRFQAQRQDAQRTGRTEMHEIANEFLPRKRGLSGLRKIAPLSTLDRASADVVVHAIERVAQHPETFHADLQDRLVELDKIAADHHENGLPVLDKTEMKANRKQAASIQKALKRANPEHVVEAANEFIAQHQPIVQELVDRGVLDSGQATRAALFPFARIHMGAGHSEELGLVDAQGKPLSNDAVLAEMKRRGVEPPGFISHRAPTKGDYWGPANERAGIPKGKRTGQAALRGTYDAGYEGVIRQLIRSRGLLDRIKTWDGFITRFGRTIREFKVQSMADAKKVLDDPARYGLNPNIKWRAVRRHPFTAMKSEMNAALEHQDPTIASEGVLAEALHLATSEHGPEGEIVFMPEQVVTNMDAQFQPLGPGLKAVQLSTTGLKRAVLPFSPSYYFGNAIDNTIRTALAGVGPQHFIAGHKIGKQLNRETKDQMLGAAMSSVEKLSARRTHEDFAGTAAQGFAEAAAAFRAAPGLKQLIDLVSATSHAMLSVNSKLTERLPQYGALGKIAMQDIRNKQGEWAAVIHLQDKYVKDIVKGLENPDTKIRYEKGLEQIYGNWSRMSPHARKFLSNFFPFWTWSRAALKLVYATLPAHHSIETGLLAAAARMTQEDREKLGLDLLGKEPLPNFLQGGIPVRGSISPWGKYNSFGYAGHPLESIATGVFPQIKDALAAGEGRDWKGSPLGGSELSHLGTAAEGGLGSYIPGYNTVKGLLEKGPGYLSPLHVESPGALPYLRSLSESTQITVPAKGSGGGGSSSGGVDYGAVSAGSGGSVDYGAVSTGGG